MPKALTTVRTPVDSRMSRSSGVGSKPFRRMCTGGTGETSTSVMPPKVPADASGPVERRFLQVQPVQHGAQHLVVDVPAVTLGDERRAFGGQHLQAQPAERRRRALTDVLLV